MARRGPTGRGARAGCDVEYCIGGEVGSRGKDAGPGAGRPAKRSGSTLARREAAEVPQSHGAGAGPTAGWRPGWGGAARCAGARGGVRGGHVWIVDVDIEKFFDEIPHEPLIEAVAERVADGSVLWLVRLFLEALIQDGYRVVRPKAGTPQGGVVSPLLANIYLARLDRVLEAEGISFVRYADDVRLNSRTEAGAQAAGVFDRHDRWITRRLRAFKAKRWRNGLWRRYPDQYFWVHLGLTRLYHLRRDFIRELEVRRRAGNRPVERSAGNPHATFVRGTEASS